MSDPLGRPPTSAAIAWAAGQFGENLRHVRIERLKGGITSAVHRLTYESSSGARQEVVLRRWVDDARADGAKRVTREARALAALKDSAVPAPELIAADPTGEASGGAPAILMTRLPGRILLQPTDLDRWLRQQVALLPVMHDVRGEVYARDGWVDMQQTAVPPWSKRPDVWRAALAAMREGPPPFEPNFVHSDFQHFNMLWSGQRLVGIVDWNYAAMGPRDVDVGHCRLTLAILFSAACAERFRLMYEAEAGRATEAWWDVDRLVRYDDSWKSFIPIQAGKRAKVDLDGMNDRVEELLALAVARL